MTPEEFVEVVRQVVMQGAVRAAVSLLERPPGRRPAPKLVAASAWYNGLSEQDREQVRGVAAMASHAAVFGFLAVLDGVRVIEDGPDKGTLTLTLRKGDQEWVLNPPNAPMLHDLLNTPPEDSPG
ncbi:hypothetical protein FGE12_02945 [Aggregicoccus sp. 17bor-14]|uniref:hypothetical protein n=1 Tax=Myxococcaceae TaxID=31 RepID=UPI00129D0B09|nr:MULTISPECIES: hypothetical protein [Myxococcaceae]MBF5041328.1 hypothetical protein [Simulacricoccus sp. 17bor-14]MRI87114.1 hypothetical protein [Aggregicoccus sp. 17bor-14]